MLQLTVFSAISVFRTFLRSNKVFSSDYMSDMESWVGFGKYKGPPLGGGQKCARCSKSVYHNELRIGANQPYHKYSRLEKIILKKKLMF